jgi:cytidine deaminase
MAHSDSSPAAACPGLTKREFETLEVSCRKAKESAYCTSQATLLKLFTSSCAHTPGPYSKFRVGCAILIKQRPGSVPPPRPLPGPVVTGANVENAAYPVGTCAERVALGWAVAQGCRAGDVAAVAVSTDLEAHASPCGMCRQFIAEFCGGGVPVLMFNRASAVKVLRVEEVCRPFAV